MQWRTVRACKVFSDYPGISKRIFFKNLIPLKPEIHCNRSLLYEISTLDSDYCDEYCVAAAYSLCFAMTLVTSCNKR